jgi:hypothetical protein
MIISGIGPGQKEQRIPKTIGAKRKIAIVLASINAEGHTGLHDAMLVRVMKSVINVKRKQSENSAQRN